MTAPRTPSSRPVSLGRARAQCTWQAVLTLFPLQDQKLRTALQDYENEKWRIVANKVGTGFTPAACRERASQLVGGPL